MSQRRLIDTLSQNIHTDPWSGGHCYCPIRRDVDRRIDKVGLVVALARGDVAGQTEVWEAGKVDIVRAANATLEHAAMPHRDVVRRAEIVELDRGLVTADAARLDVDDLASLRLDGVTRDADGVN